MRRRSASCVVIVMFLCVDMYLTSWGLFFLIIGGSAGGLAPGPIPDAGFEDLCAQRCPYQNKTEDNYEAGCGIDCKLVQCSRGCQLWRKALETSCQTVCNGTQSMLAPRELHCVLGCNGAIDQYFQQIKDEIGIPPAPYLVADTLTATSLSLAWDGRRYLDISYLVQWRYEEHAGAWQYCRNQTWGPASIVQVDNLQPFTKYRFRVAVLLSPHSEPIVSRPSVVISTLAAGPPTSAPIIVRATAVDSRRISVSWKPGPFPNGPIHSYVLQLIGDTIAFKEDVPVTQNADFHIFQNLNANSKYIATVTMRNAVGEGPAAVAEVNTPPDPQVKDKPQPILILSSHQRVIKQRADMLNPPQVIYESSYNITGIAIHVKKNLLFVSDTSQFVTRSSLYGEEEKRKILSPEDSAFRPLDLSVDWLNQHLYILGEVKREEGPMWQVSRCNFDGRGLTVAVAGLIVKPLHIEVDPYNGYLFWVIQGPIHGGLYRLDLANISNGIKHEVVPYVVVNRPNLGAFVVDHKNFCILVPSLDENTVFAVSLDGRTVKNVRGNTQQALFRNVTSLAIANGLFYWTNGNEVFAEDYHEGQNTYFHNHYPGLSDLSYVSVAVDLPASQPTPVPINPPIHVQAVLGGRNAKITWQPPHLVGGQGKGAWQNWMYNVQVENTPMDAIEPLNSWVQSDINTTECTVNGLSENTEYTIKVAARTSSGMGPWSTEFRGKTLKSSRIGQYPLLWATSEGLLQSSITGEEVETLIPSEAMKGNKGSYHIVDIAWAGDVIYYVSNSSKIYWYNLSLGISGRIPDLDSVGSLAVDWIGKKLYWSNPKQQLIMRGDLEGGHQEPLPILTTAKELRIDAENAFIYWSTGHAVESARLNGEARRVYYPAQLFSGKQVMGLTLNTDDQHVYWIVGSSEGYHLYKAPMMNEDTSVEIEPITVAKLPHTTMQGPLCYFSDHLLWLQDNRNAVICDLNGQNAAVITGIRLNGLNVIAVRDTEIRDAHEGLIVIPEPVRNSSIQIEGTWSSFNITWNANENVNHGVVYYEVIITKEHSEEQHILDKNVLVFQDASDTPPFSRLGISVKAFTFWGASSPVRTVRYSPPSIPSAPVNVRAFTQPERDRAAVVLRWDPPLHPNGLLTGYKIKSWDFEISDHESSEMLSSFEMDSNVMEFWMKDLLPNNTYYFQVQALNIAGEGEFSPEIAADVSILSPIPRLILATRDYVKIADCDSKEFQSITSAMRPVDVVWSNEENAIYWLNDLKEIHRVMYDGTNKTKIHTLKGTGLALALDWVGRFLYWSELEDREMTSSIHRLDLTQADFESNASERIIRRNRLIHELEISPFTSSLFWVEVNRHGAGHLMRSRIDGNAMHTLFSVHFDPRRQCSCPENPRVGRTLTLDQTDPSNPTVLYSDDLLGYIYQTGPCGCNCSLFLRTHSKVIPSSLTTDHRHVFWSNETEGKIYFTDRNLTTTEISEPGVRRIRAIGNHLQPLPPNECLLIASSIREPQILEATSRSVILQLPQITAPNHCQNISKSSPLYTIYYGIVNEEGYSPCSENLNACMMSTSFHKSVEIGHLKPFSDYAIRVFVQNHYTQALGLSGVEAPTIMIKTSAGAPSPPREVKVTLLTPTHIEVEWLPPTEFNDRSVAYEVHWKTEGIVLGMRQSGELEISAREEAFESIHNITKKAQVRKLIPGQLYQVWVRAYSQNSKFFMDSDPIEIDTYPFPNNISLAQATPYSLEVFWSPPKDLAKANLLQYYDFRHSEWRNVTRFIEDLSFTRYYIEELKPKTSYLFRTFIIYNNAEFPFTWPNDARFKFETLGDRPSRPGTPVIQHLRRGVYQVVWEPSRENGAHIEMYLLEGQEGGKWRKRREANYTTMSEFPVMEENNPWTTYYNGTDNYWIITDLSPSLKYVFRVRSKNEYGWSDSSETSKSFDYNEAALIADQQELGIVLGITLPIAVLVCLVGSLIFCCLFKRREKEKKELQVLTIATNSRGPDVELATLRELPRRGNFITNANMLYAAADPPTDEEIAMLPHIRREQFKLTKFLGSGAFGEVYEGIAQAIFGTEGNTMVAIKALRKGASEQEKSEFLKEAQLMSHFKHQHILQLVGVCLDNDPNYILMELMEGGDLLSYLRNNRPLINSRNAIKLQDLLEMCVDVAAGCRYLEDMHFVHRDLACRNCLVSSLDPRTRVVKIGDFGLARDIYKNDYYRKEGEGLLPVRWMAPESLVDGVFTSQSDVWSFGVLLWEIMTLGQQPYPARTNLEVLHYVRVGGRLGRPSNCSEELHQLMMKCWSFKPDNRPTFKSCLDTLTCLKEQTANAPLTPPLSSSYMEVRTGGNLGNENEAYFDEGDSEDSASAWKGESEDGSAKSVQSPHAYLQLLYEEDPPVDGYEVPRNRSFSKDSEDRDTPSLIQLLPTVPLPLPPPVPQAVSSVPLLAAPTITSALVPSPPTSALVSSTTCALVPYATPTSALVLPTPSSALLPYSTPTSVLQQDSPKTCTQPLPPSLVPDLSTIDHLLVGPAPD